MRDQLNELDLGYNLSLAICEIGTNKSTSDLVSVCIVSMDAQTSVIVLH